MNNYLDYGGFLLVLYSMTYATSLGKQPEWFNLFFGSFALIIIGVGIEIYKKVKKKNE